MKEKLMIFPYNKDTLSLLYAKELISDYDLSVICSFKEDKYVMLRELKELNIYSTVEFETALDEVQVILFCDNMFKIDLSGYAYKVIIAHKKGKKILIGRNLFNDLSNEFSTIKELEKDLKIIESSYSIRLTDTKRVLHPIETPVICIYGFGQDCDKFDTHIALSNKMKTKNYKCLDSEIIPDFVYYDTLSFHEKIRLFNMYIYDLEQKYSPDVIIISSPFGIMPRNIYISNKFGEESLIISNALNVDAGILCVDYIDSINSDYCEELKKLLKYRFSTPLSAICISSVKKRFRFDDRLQECYYLNNDYETKRSDLKDHAGFIYYSFDKRNQDICIEKLIHELEENVNVF